MPHRFILIAAVLVLAPLGAQAADLVVWRDEPWYAEEEEALAAVVDAFEQESGKQVEVAFYPAEELPAKIMAALEAAIRPIWPTA
jgi:ABC-type glycerol-3-phosphate transport system substrate-binding protein